MSRVFRIACGFAVAAALAFSGVESGAVEDGSSSAIVAPIYDGTAASGGSASYIRLFNGGTSSSTFTITVVGSPSGRNYGVATYAVPAGASQQRVFSDILFAAGAASLSGGDTTYTMYIRNTDSYAGYQHVTFNQTTSFFENASVCSRFIDQAFASATSRAVLLNVHTTRIAGWPSKVQIHNPGATAASYQVAAVDSETGGAVGTPFTLAVAANETRVLPIATLQTALGITNPTATHLNIFVTDPTDTASGAALAHQVLNLTLNAEFNLTTACATEAASTQTLTLTKAGAGSGSVTSSPAAIECGDQCSSRTEAFARGTTVTLTASAASGSTFTGWSGSCGGNGTCTLTMNGSESVTATFAASGSAGGGGSGGTGGGGTGGGSSGGGGSGATFTLTVLKSGSGGSSLGNGGQGYVSSSPVGIDCGAVCTYAFAAGTNVTMLLPAGTPFQNWSGACSGTSDCSVTMNANQTVTANYGAPSGSFMLTVTKGGSQSGFGFVTSSPTGISCEGDCVGGSSHAFTAGTTVSLTATPTGGTTFQGWSGACTGTGSCSVTMNSTQSVQANFGPPTNLLTVSKTGSGNIVSTPAGINCGNLGSECSHAFETGTTVSLTALSYPGSLAAPFQGWSGACSSTSGNNGNVCSVTISGSQSVSATFVP